MTWKYQFIPPPIDGINVISDPSSFKLSEARVLDNYYIYDWGIRERAPSGVIAIPDGKPPTYMLSFTSAGYRGTMIGVNTGNLTRFRASDNSFTTLEAARTIGHMFAFQKKIFFCDAVSNKVTSYDLATDVYTNTTAFTGITEAPTYGFIHNSRVYLLFQGKSYFKYGPLSGVSGALSSSYDVGQFFQRPGQQLMWGASWSTNQGLSNESLLVVGNEYGEVFIYGGAYPDANDWRLITRVDLPAPLCYVNNAANQVSVLNVGQDLWINTTRGLVSLSDVIASRESSGGNYFIRSRKIGYVLQNPIAAISNSNPFAYFGGGQGTSLSRDVYVMNYERGAWSRFPGVAPSGKTIACISCSTPVTGAALTNPPDSYVLFGLSDGSICRVNESDTASDPGLTHTWSTPFIDFGANSAREYRPGTVRVIGRDIRSTSISNSVSVTSNYNDQHPGQTSSLTTTVSSQDYTTQDLSPGGSGKQLSFTFSKTGSGSAMNEIAGFTVLYEESQEMR